MAVVVRGGKAALTRYRVLKVLGRGAYSLVECRLATGRTHQIRVHLAHAGHPLVGDPVYGGRRNKATTGPAASFGRQALDAVSLGFEHPVTAQRMTFMKKYNNDFNMLIELLDPL